MLLLTYNGVFSIVLHRKSKFLSTQLNGGVREHPFRQDGAVGDDGGARVSLTELRPATERLERPPRLPGISILSSEVALIVCHEHKFIFLKTRKTAGTSIEISLSRLAGPGDVVTKVSPRDEKIRAEMGIEPRGYRGRFNPVPEILFGSYREKIQAIREFVKGKKFRNHSSSFKIRNRVGREVWDSYFKFCFERNPWDKTVSHFYWNRAKPGKGDLTFEQYVKRGAFPVDRPRWCRHDRLQVDFVGRFENLKEDLTTALARVGIEFDGWLPRAKGGTRDPESRPYQRFLSDEVREKITRAFTPEIELLGYRFEEKGRPPRLTRHELEG